MERMCSTVGLIVGSSAGGWMGAPFGLMMGVVASSVGAGLGLYVARRALHGYLD